MQEQTKWILLVIGMSDIEREESTLDRLLAHNQSINQTTDCHNQRHVTITIVSHRDDDCLCNLRRESVCNRKLNKTPPYRELSIQPAVWTRALASLVQHRSKGGVNCVLSAGILVSKGCFRFTIRLSEKGV